MATRIPELPHDKTYHLFVCYESSNVDVVRRIVNNLEHSGIVCCYHDRDFLPGRSVFENMYGSIKESLSMLIVLSENFENSNYCLHELDEALNLKVRGEINLIPIKTEPCSVPEFIRHLTFIDVEDDIKTAHTRIVDAMNKRDLRNEFSEGRNGESMQFDIRTYKPSILALKRYRLEFTEADRIKIWQNGFEVSAELLNDVEKTVNASSFMKHLYILYFWCLLLCLLHFCLLILVMIIFLVLLLTTTERMKTDHLQPAGFALAVGIPTCAVLFFCTLPFSCHRKGNFGVYVKMYRVLAVELWYMSKQNIAQSGVLFFLSHKGTSIYVFFARRLESREYLKTLKKENETTEECTRRIFDTFMRSLCGELNTPSTTQRHKMNNGAKCACLLIEDKFKQ